jgi:hypothetical protein
MRLFGPNNHQLLWATRDWATACYQSLARVLKILGGQARTLLERQCMFYGLSNPEHGSATITTERLLTSASSFLSPCRMYTSVGGLNCSSREFANLVVLLV